MSDGRRHWRRRRRARDLRPSSSCQKVRAMRRREREGRRAGRSIRREHGPLKTVITTDVEKSQSAHNVTVFLYMCLHVGRMWCTERTSSYNRKVSLTFNKGGRFKVLQSHSNVVLVLFTQIFKTVWIFPRSYSLLSVVSLRWISSLHAPWHSCGFTFSRNRNRRWWFRDERKRKDSKNKLVDTDYFNCRTNVCNSHFWVCIQRFYLMSIIILLIKRKYNNIIK